MTVRVAAADAAGIAEAARLLRDGALVAFPTETVYGLGALALDADAVGRLFTAKGRPATNPVICHVADVAAARALSRAWPAAADALAARLWPGPLTLVVPRAAHVPDAVTAGHDAVAIRVPAHPVALALLRAVGAPVAAPSANPSTQLSPTTAAHVAAGLGDRVALILDGGPTTVGIESTVLDLSGEVPVLLRPGTLDRPTLESLVGPIDLAGGDAPRVAPGMMEVHYAPRARLAIAPHAEAAESLVAEAIGAGHAAGLVRRREGTGEELQLVTEGRSRAVVTLPASPEGYARHLYAALHALDGLGVGRIVVEAVPDQPAWDGVRDRLRRAASK